MSNQFIFGISLTGSFLAGVLALFAPCCITFLFPSYLGLIFKQGKKVMFYTLVYSLGISLILIPVALGARFFVFLFDSFHREIYYLGGLFLVFMGIMTIKPLFHLPKLINVKINQEKKIDVFSVFSLGVISGLSSSCCAPVLLVAVTLTSLSPTILQGLIVSFAYVLGIVFPLFLLSLFYKTALDRLLAKNRQRIYQGFKILGGLIFALSGVALIIANYFNKLQMGQMESYNRSLRLLIFYLAQRFQNPIIDIAVFLIIVYLFYQLLKKYR